MARNRHREAADHHLPDQTIRIPPGKHAPQHHPRREPPVVYAPPVRREPPHPQTDSRPPHQSPGKRKKRRRLGCGCLTLPLFLIFFLLVTFAGLWAFEAFFGPPPLETLPQSQRAAVAEERAAQNVNLILVGADHRGDEPSRSDTVIFTVLRPVDNEVALLSLPRDSLVELPGYGMDKLNAAYSYGELPLLKDTVQGLLQTGIDHYLVVDFDSFEKVIDAMGGLTINVPERMYLPEENIDLQPGRRHLNGYDALAYVRWRDDGQGDLGRIERQQEFMQALSKKSRRMMPWQVVRTLQVLNREVETDLNALEMVQLAYGMIGMRGDAVHSYQLAADAQYIDGVSYVLLDPMDVANTVTLMRYGTDIQ